MYSYHRDSNAHISVSYITFQYTMLYICLLCDQLNEQHFICSHCEGTVLIEFKITSEEKTVSGIDDVKFDGPKCPHCGIGIEIVAENCKIFRCGVTTSGQIGQHLKKEEVEKLMKSGTWIMGCGKPFKIDSDKNILIKCGYDT